MEYLKTLKSLESGDIRAANKVNDKWFVNTKVKEDILKAFKDGKLTEMDGFVDKHNIPARNFTKEDGVRLVPGGSSVRTGSYVASGVIIMPPAYINIGAYVDEGTMVDSHALVGSCAQIGKNVHLSAGVQIGGVLEPIGMNPVIIEDNCFIGAGAVIVEGIQVNKNAVIAPGVILSAGTPVYDCINEKVFSAKEGIPENAVVIPGTRPVNKTLSWANEMNINLQCAVIIKYRDDKTDGALELESYLR
jgi:2,3,4,5-tetrahydropyridine-2-carboxylate N-succinyltransferase